jgi:hypothetical protein
MDGNKKSRRAVLSQALGTGLTAGLAVAAVYTNFGTGNTPALAEGPYPRMHHALDALRDAREELDKAHEDFHGHKDEAMKAIDEAIRQLKAIVG